MKKTKIGLRLSQNSPSYGCYVKEPTLLMYEKKLFLSFFPEGINAEINREQLNKVVVTVS